MGLPVLERKEEQREKVSSGVVTRAADAPPVATECGRRGMPAARGLDAPGLRRGKSAATARERSTCRTLSLSV
jgi:hypothetical protein